MQILYVSHHDKFYTRLATSYKLTDSLSQMLTAVRYFFFALD